MSPERISESVTPTPSLREIRRIRRLMRRGFRLPLLPYLAQLRPPLVLPPRSRTPAAAISPVASVPVSWHPAYWFYKLVRERAMRALSSPYFLSFRCPPLPFLHRRFVWQRRSRLAHSHDKPANVICEIYFCRDFIFELKKNGRNIDSFFRKASEKTFPCLIH